MKRQSSSPAAGGHMAAVGEKSGYGIRYLHTRRQALLFELLATRGYEHLLLLGGQPDLLLAAGTCARAVTATGLAASDELTAQLRARRLRATLLPERPDPANLPFADQTFDGLLLPAGLETVTDLDAAVAGLARVCRAGGVLVVGSPVIDRLTRIPLLFFRPPRQTANHDATAVLRALPPYFTRTRLVTYPAIMPAGSAMFYLCRCCKGAD